MSLNISQKGPPMSVATLSPAVTVTDEQKRQYKEEGYCILERAIPQEQLKILPKILAYHPISIGLHRAGCLCEPRRPR